MTDNRLLTCAGLVKGKIAVDVGTDHGYLAVHLVTEGICTEVIACDVNEKPLESARKTVQKLNLLDSIKIILSDGLDNVPKDGVTDVIMAGMGGELIASLIDKCPWLKDINNPVNLVLQPMSKSEILRKWLYDNGYQVSKEIACKDRNFVYSVMQVKYIGTTPDYDCDDRFLFGGKVSSCDNIGRLYLEKQAKRLKIAGMGMLKSDNKNKQGQKLINASEQLLVIKEI